MKKISNKTIILALAILLILAISYIGVGKYNQRQMQKQVLVYQQGLQAGYQQAIIQIMQQAVTCQQVPLFAQNQTMNIVAVECLQKSEG